MCIRDRNCITRSLSSEIRQPFSFPFFSVIFNFESSNISVSYTHLDVYKRQPPFHIHDKTVRSKALRPFLVGKIDW